MVTLTHGATKHLEIHPLAEVLRRGKGLQVGEGMMQSRANLLEARLLLLADRAAKTTVSKEIEMCYPTHLEDEGAEIETAGCSRALDNLLVDGGGRHQLDHGVERLAEWFAPAALLGLRFVRSVMYASEISERTGGTECTVMVWPNPWVRLFEFKS